MAAGGGVGASFLGVGFYFLKCTFGAGGRGRTVGLMKILKSLSPVDSQFMGGDLPESLDEPGKPLGTNTCLSIIGRMLI